MTKAKTKSRIVSTVKYEDPPLIKAENSVLAELLNSECVSSANEAVSDLRLALSSLDAALNELRTRVSFLDTATANYRSNKPIPALSQPVRDDENTSMTVRVLNEITDRINFRNAELDVIYNSIDRL